jgi:hypothetical protein
MFNDPKSRLQVTELMKERKENIRQLDRGHSHGR